MLQNRRIPRLGCIFCVSNALSNAYLHAKTALLLHLVYIFSLTPLPVVIVTCGHVIGRRAYLKLCIFSFS